MNPTESGQSEINQNESGQSGLIQTFKTESIQLIWSIRTFNPNESSLSESIRMIPKNSVSFGLYAPINSD